MYPIEIWKEVFKNKIPKDQYEVLLESGEKTGLIIKLSSENYKILIDFGIVLGVRVLDEGIILNDSSNFEQVQSLKKHGFDNIIYEVINGEFQGFIKQIGGNLCDYLELKHYIIITINYVIEIVTQWKPDIEVMKLEIDWQ